MIAVPPSVPSAGAYDVLNRSTAPVEALGAVLSAGALDAAAGGCAGAELALGDTLPPHAAAMSTAVLAPISNRRRVPPDRLVIVCSFVAGAAGRADAHPWLAEAVATALTCSGMGTRHAPGGSDGRRSRPQGSPMGTRPSRSSRPVTGSNPTARRPVWIGNAGREILGAVSANRARPGRQPAAVPPDRGGTAALDPGWPDRGWRTPSRDPGLCAPPRRRRRDRDDGLRAADRGGVPRGAAGSRHARRAGPARPQGRPASAVRAARAGPGPDRLGTRRAPVERGRR